jgi:hypothetical protein
MFLCLHVEYPKSVDRIVTADGIWFAVSVFSVSANTTFRTLCIPLLSTACHSSFWPLPGTIYSIPLLSTACHSSFWPSPGTIYSIPLLSTACHSSFWPSPGTVYSIPLLSTACHSSFWPSPGTIYSNVLGKAY